MAFTRWEIKAALGHGGAKEIADRLGVRAAAVSDVISGRSRNRPIRVAIARKVGKPVDEVFAPEHSADDASDGLKHTAGAA